jgi:excisionase family DNA binding protein
MSRPPLTPERDLTRQTFRAVMSYSKTCEGKMTKPLTVKEAAEQLGYHPDHLRRLLRRGTVKGETFSGVWMVNSAEVERIKALQGPGGRLPKTPRR